MSQDNTASNAAADAAKSQDMTEGLAEQSKQPDGTNITQTAASNAFDSDGSIGKQFTSEGAIGGTAQEIGGPLHEEGAIGKQFTEQGSIGGTAQSLLGSKGK